MVTRTGAIPSQNKGAIDKLLTRAFVRLALVDLAYFTSAGVAITRCRSTSPGRWGPTEAAAGLAFGAFAVSALLLRPFAGRLSDTRGRRPLPHRRRRVVCGRHTGDGLRGLRGAGGRLASGAGGSGGGVLRRLLRRPG